MPKQTLTPEIITAAIEGFEVQKTRLDDQIRDLRAMLPGNPTEPAATSGVAKPAHRKISAAGRRAIAEAQRKRWAESKRLSEHSENKAGVKKPKRKLSAAGRKAIIAATKKRWALKRAEAAKA